jgi:hypothetical protein
MPDAKKAAEPKYDERQLLRPNRPVVACQDHSDTELSGGFLSALRFQALGPNDERDCSRREFINEDRAGEQSVRIHLIG